VARRRLGLVGANGASSSVRQPGVSRAVAQAREALIDLAPHAASAARARAFVRDFVDPATEPEALDGAELVVSELVTNAVLYALPPIRLRLRLDNDLLRIEVDDASRRLPQVKHNAPEALTGRGLHLVGHYGVAWGAETLERGKTVWCEVRASRATTARASASVRG
jgi:hypothetical protein